MKRLLFALLLSACQTGPGHNAAWEAKLARDRAEDEAKVRRKKAQIGDCVENAFPANEREAGKTLQLIGRKVVVENGKKLTTDEWGPCVLPSFFHAGKQTEPPASAP